MDWHGRLLAAGEFKCSALLQRMSAMILYSHPN